MGKCTFGSRIRGTLQMAQGGSTELKLEFIPRQAACGTAVIVTVAYSDRFSNPQFAINTVKHEILE